jgi:DNA-binding PadR family transcriptional regulator
MFHHFIHSRFGRCAEAMSGGEDGPRGFGPRERGRGGPFGRHRGGPFGGRGPRMFDSGALRLVVLGLISAEPRHGYDIIKALEARFQGAYSPSPGAIYPMLQMLEEADLVSSVTTGSKRLYTITEAGRIYVEENRAELDRINAQLDQASGDIRHSAIGEELHALRSVLHGKLRTGALTAEQSDRLRAILQQARKDIEDL